MAESARKRKPVGMKTTKIASIKDGFARNGVTACSDAEKMLAVEILPGRGHVDNTRKSFIMSLYREP